MSSSKATARLVGGLVLLICLVCPILEVFDSWDHTAQSGNDTEYTLVLVGLCTGVAYTLSRYVAASPTTSAVSELIQSFSASRPLALGTRSSFFIVPIPLSPPALALRI